MIKLDSFQHHKDGSTYANQSVQYNTTRKDKNHMNISIGTGKALDKIQNP